MLFPKIFGRRKFLILYYLNEIYNIEKEVKIHGKIMRLINYILILFNAIFASKNKLAYTSVEATTRCTLKCGECINLIPMHQKLQTGGVETTLLKVCYLK